MSDTEGAPAPGVGGERGLGRGPARADGPPLEEGNARPALREGERPEREGPVPRGPREPGGKPSRGPGREEALARLSSERERVARVLGAAADALAFPEGIDRTDPTALLSRIPGRLRTLIPLTGVAFYLLSESGLDFDLALADPPGSAPLFGREIDPLVEDGTVAWALSHNHPVFASRSGDEGGDLFLHALATPARTVGLCLGFLSERPEEILDVGLAFSTVVLNQVAGAIEDARDARTILSLNEALSVKVADLEEARRALEAANRSKDLFVANTGHELRTPLAALIGTARLLEDSPLDPHQTELVRLIRKEGGAALRILSDLLDLSRIEAGRLEVASVPFDPVEVALEVESRFAPRAEAKGLDFRLLLDARLPRSLRGDPDRVRQILSNLADNAIKFTPRGEVSLEVSRARDRILYSVRDSGVGIGAETAERLFRPFERGGGAAGRVGGTGLGLALSRRLAQAMGGDLTLESREGEGSLFRLSLPVSCPEGDSPGGAAAEERPSPAGEEHPLPAADLKSRDVPAAAPDRPEGERRRGGGGRPGGRGRILLAEDNPTQRLVASAFLRRCGYVPVPASDGDEAAARLREENFAGALLDIQMPGRTGLDLIRAIRSGEFGDPDLPVLGTTAGVMRGEMENLGRAGFDGLLPKPFSPEELAAAMARAAEARRPGRPEEGPEVRPEGETPPRVPPPRRERAGRPSYRSGSGRGIPGVLPGGTFPPLSSALLRRAGGDETLARQVLFLFAADLEEGLARIAEALERQDFSEAGRFAHALAGAGASVGAESLASLARDLERAAGGERERIPEVLRLLALAAEEYRKPSSPEKSRGENLQKTAVSEENAPRAGGREEAETEEGEDKDGMDGMKILIAEDNAASRRLLAGFLQGKGYEVVEAADGNEALAILLGEDPPSLAVVDWLMPGLTGTEICRRVRQAGRRLYQYLILLTIRRERERIVEGLRSGADDYVIKPFDPEELELRIAAGRRVLAAQEALAHAASHDPLTGILNRGAIIEREEEELSRARREGSSVAALMIDLDHFKQINDRYGHLVGRCCSAPGRPTSWRASAATNSRCWRR